MTNKSCLKDYLRSVNPISVTLKKSLVNAWEDFMFPKILKFIYQKKLYKVFPNFDKNTKNLHDITNYKLFRSWEELF